MNNVHKSCDIYVDVYLFGNNGYTFWLNSAGPKINSIACCSLLKLK